MTNWYILIALAMVAAAAAWGIAAFWPMKKARRESFDREAERYPVAGPIPLPWVTREDVEEILRVRTSPVGFAGEAHHLVTFGHLATALDERDERPVSWEDACAIMVPRKEFEPLLAAYCRKSLDDGELKARVLQVVREVYGNPPDIVFESHPLPHWVNCPQCQSGFSVARDAPLSGTHTCGSTYVIDPSGGRTYCVPPAKAKRKRRRA
jgi:hypothetical protein